MTGRRIAPTSAVVVAAAMIVVVAAVASLARMGAPQAQWPMVVALGALLLIGEACRGRMPDGRDVAPLGTALALAMALLPQVGTDPQRPPGVALVVVVTTVAMGLGVVASAVRRGSVPTAEVAARRVLVVALVAWLFRFAPLLDGRTALQHVDQWADRRWLLALVMVGIIAAVVVLETTMAALVWRDRGLVRLRSALVDEVRAEGALQGAVGVTAVLIALAATSLGLLAVPLLAAPLVMTQLGFRRFWGISTTYRQTVRSLSRLPEFGGYTDAGHSVRVRDLAVAMGRDLGMDDRQVRDLETAALMHDIGQISLTDPIPGGATLLATAEQQQQIADLGADIVHETGSVEVAVLVRRQAERYRTPTADLRGTGPDAVPLASRIVKVANSYDDLMGDDTSVGRRLEALERLHLGLAFDYDPVVVESLTRVLNSDRVGVEIV